jgi:hypothetical protein
VPDQVAVRVGEALRSDLPKVTAGLESDGQVARAVFAWLVGNVLAQYEVDKVRAPKAEPVRDARADQDASVTATWQVGQSIVPVSLLIPESGGSS